MVVTQHGKLISISMSYLRNDSASIRIGNPEAKVKTEWRDAYERKRAKNL
jgi:hypothetical protein